MVYRTVLYRPIVPLHAKRLQKNVLRMFAQSTLHQHYISSRCLKKAFAWMVCEMKRRQNRYFSDIWHTSDLDLLKKHHSTVYNPLKHSKLQINAAASETQLFEIRSLSSVEDVYWNQCKLFNAKYASIWKTKFVKLAFQTLPLELIGRKTSQHSFIIGKWGNKSLRDLFHVLDSPCAWGRGPFVEVFGHYINALSHYSCPFK